MIRVKEEQPKCEFGHCEHPPEDHHEGTCWKIIRPELKDEPTNRKYCDCCVTMEPRSKKSIKGWQEIAHYEGNGWMEAEPCLECSKNDDKIPSGLIIVCVDPKSKTGKPKDPSIKYKITDNVANLYPKTIPRNITTKVCIVIGTG